MDYEIVNHEGHLHLHSIIWYIAHRGVIESIKYF